MTLGITPNVLQRAPGFVDLAIPNKPGILRWRIQAARTLDLARTAPQNMFEVESGLDFRSKKIRQRKLMATEAMRGSTRILFDFMDYYDGGGGPGTPTIPHDTEMAFIRVQEFSAAAGAYLPSGPILVLPQPDFYSNPNPTLLVAAVAPDDAGLDSLGNPIVSPNAVHVVLPRFSDNMNLTNLDPAGGNNVFYSFGHERLAASLIPQANEFAGSAVKEMVVSGDGADVEFSMTFGIANLG